jgi:2-hydroxycyclohexanecarboxyl-CoA dehydrogenase
MDLNNRTALVTGGARGIGAAIARQLAVAGATVAIVDLDGEGAVQTAAALPRPGLGLAADCADEAAMQDAVARIVECCGALDILVNNAGGGRPGSGVGHPFTRISAADWDDQLAINLRTAFAASKAAIPFMQQRGGGSIVNIASIAGQLPAPTTPAYGAAKAGMIALGRSLALELAPHGIRVNTVCPGLIWTQAWEQLASLIRDTNPKLAGVPPHAIFDERVRKAVPLKREQTVEDVAALALFLCSEAARNITGQTIAVDGGITLQAA